MKYVRSSDRYCEVEWEPNTDGKFGFLLYTREASQTTLTPSGKLSMSRKVHYLIQWEK